MRAIRRFFWSCSIGVLPVAGLAVLVFPHERVRLGTPAYLDAAEISPPVALTADELIEQLLPNLSDEHMRKELAEQMDALPAEMKAALPPEFKQRFIDKFIMEGLPELKTSVALQIKETYTEAELRALLDFRRKYPNIIQKQEILLKSVMKQSMEIGQRIGKSLAK